ncbi:MAG: RNA methyltransferase [Bacteroidales bacterium]|nr:RNA methyltransferase [Bacteroidales bacterium]
MKKLKLEELNRPDIETFRNQTKLPVVIVLDNIRSLNNVGSVFRTADAFSVTEVLLCGITGKPPHKDIHKTALGATESVRWKYFEKTTEAIAYLKAQEYKIFALEQTDTSIDIFYFEPNKNFKTAFVFGNEVSGVDDSVLNIIDKAIEIPQFGTKHSFNIAVTVGIVLWDYFYKTKKSRL